MSKTAENPTFQSSGAMRVYVQSRVWTNGGGGIEIYPGQTKVYGADWEEGKNWKPLTDTKSIKSLPDQAYQPLLNIIDRGKNALPLNSTCTFKHPILDLAVLKIYFEIHAVEGGTIIKPGVGLYNLSSQPNEWTYITPNVFEGTWSISWWTPKFISPATITIGYSPCREVNLDEGVASRLWYILDGFGPTHGAGEPGAEKASLEQQILIT